MRRIEAFPTAPPALRSAVKSALLSQSQSKSVKGAAVRSSPGRGGARRPLMWCQAAAGQPAGDDSSSPKIEMWQVEQARLQLEWRRGVRRRRVRFLPFEEARKWAHAMGFDNKAEWEYWADNRGSNPYIPREPDKAYKDQFQGWDDWLGLPPKRPYEQASEFARALGLSSWGEWAEFCRSGDLPEDVPRRPQAAYKDQGWAGWDAFLGVGDRPDDNR